MPPIAAPFSPSADRRSALDRAHIGDIRGAIGTVPAFDTGPRRTLRRRLLTFLAIAGPGLIVMTADNDAGTMSVFAQAGQGYGTRLLWVLVLLAPVLYIGQEMAARLGAVTGTGHARLILERFGRTWCAFSLGDLMVLNFALLVTEFIGVALSLAYFGISRYVAVPLAAGGLIALSSGGNFRRWESAMYVLVIADLSVIVLAILHHPRPEEIAIGLLPRLRDQGASSWMLLFVALIGTTISPWQIFFQQSNVIDKRITPRWLAYERVDTALGAFVFIAAAGAIMIACAAAFGHSAGHLHLLDAGMIAHALARRSGGFAGAVFALALLNASLLGAGAVSLSSSYATSEVLGVKHSLHRRFKDAKVFHGCAAALIAAAAGTVLIPGAPLGAITTLVQALAGILLPVALVLLLMLCNDSELLGPLTNSRWMNAVAVLAVAAILSLSTMLTITTVFPGAGIAEAAYATAAAFGAGGCLVAIVLFRRRRVTGPRQQLTPWQRRTWSSPALERIAPAERTRAGILTLALLRGYTLVMIMLLLAKLGSLAAT